MKRHVMAVLIMIICISGCAKMPPHEELTQAIQKSFEATGLNYSSKNRITNLSVQKQDEQADSDDKRLKYLGTGLGILRGFSLNAEGAVDKKANRCEAVYDLHYDKDNVEVSIKMPLLIDYNTQTIYVGKSFFNTILETVYPKIPAVNGKLIEINIKELLEKYSENYPELSDIIEKSHFNSKNVDSFNSATKAGMLKALAKMKDTSFIDQPLADTDRKSGVRRHIHVNLNHSDSVSAVVDFIDGASQTLFQDGVINKKEYAAILTLTNKQSVDRFADKFTMNMVFDVGIAKSGLVNYVESQLNVAYEEGQYQLGLDNLSSFSSYNAPHFTLNPETSGTVDFKELLDAIKAGTPKKTDKSPSTDEKSDGPDNTEGPSRTDI